MLEGKRTGRERKTPERSGSFCPEAHMEELGAAAETEEPVQEEEIQGRTSRGREPSWGSAEREANAPEAWQQGVVGDRDQSDGDRGLTGGLSGGRGGEPQAG